jgi:hypothetical protein
LDRAHNDHRFEVSPFEQRQSGFAHRTSLSDPGSGFATHPVYLLFISQYLAAGGLDFLIGGGRLNYAPEYAWESYYSARLFPGLPMHAPSAL